LASPALQRGKKGLHKFITESRRDGARALFMQEPIKPDLEIAGLNVRAEARTLQTDRCSLAPVRTAFGIHALLGQPQPLHRPPPNQVLIHNLRRILNSYMPVPHRLRIHHHRWPMFALVQAAGLVDPHRRAQPRRLGELIQLGVQFAFAIAGARWPWCIGGPGIVADKDVTFKCGQRVFLQKCSSFQTNAPTPK